MKNPFVEGDVIWFVDPLDDQLERVFQVVDEGDSFQSSSGFWYDLEEVLEECARLKGPYRVTQTEDWSNYNFEESAL